MHPIAYGMSSSPPSSITTSANVLHPMTVKTLSVPETRNAVESYVVPFFAPMDLEAAS
jgi:hypothetical protein